MSKIVAVHSFRGGTGKSNTTANIAALMAAQGKTVAVVDTDIQSPGIHVLFGVKQEDVSYSLNDYLWGQCDIEDVAINITEELAGLDAHPGHGQLYFIPASINPSDIARILHEGYDVNLLNDGFRALIKKLSLDVLLIDTHPGLIEETLLSITMCNSLIVVLRPDQQDYEGTDVTLLIARRLRVPDMFLVVNKVPMVFDAENVRDHVKSIYDCEVGAVLPHSDELMALASREVFALNYPDHSLTELYRQIAARALA